MNKSTPISHLQNQQQFNQNDNIVNDILKEIETTNNQQQPSMNGNGMNQSQQQFQMEPTQQSVQHMQQQDQQILQEQQQFQEQQQQQQFQEQNMQEQYVPTQQNDFNNLYQEQEPKNLLETILEEGKLPLIVSLLVIAFNVKQLDSSVIKFIPKALGEDGNITIVGLLTKGIFAGLIYYLLKKFI